MKYPQLISILLFTISKFCLANDTLSPGLTLSDGQTLISPGEVMELGFFSPGTSKGKFLGIWYKNTPDIVVWVANRNSPVIDSKGVFAVTSNGSLVLSTIENPILWSSSSHRATSNPVLKLLDNGNLVLVDESMTNSNESSRISYIWQSFDFPGDTRLPEMQMVHSNLDSGLDKYLTSWKSENDPSSGDFILRIENKGLAQITILMGTKKRYRTGPWNGYYFTGLPFYSAPALKIMPIIVYSEDGLISITEPYNSSIITRLTMNYSGYAQRYVMNEERDAWNLLISVPSDSCDNYGHCGPNGICRISKIPTCECLIGFKPKSQRQWSLLNWSSGCTRILPSDCRQEVGFLKVERIKLPDLLNFKLNDSMSFGECKYECLKQCNCTAFTDPYINKSSGGCLMWFGDLIDVRELTDEFTYSKSINIRVPVSELVSTTDNWNEKKMEKKKPSKAIIAITTGVGLLVLLLGSVGTIILRTRRNRQASRKEQEDLELPLYDFTNIAAATNNFSLENVIGEGGFGPVYKGDLSEGQVIAVKRMSRSSGQGPEEFRNEVTLIAKLQHRNLVRILGCCIKGEERMLIYEYMENRSLDSFIFDQNRRALLPWPKRFDIIMGIARGLLYLHHDSRLKVIHRDLKTSNILLDGNLNAKISDFGIANV